jgi:hypothetical protein
MNTVIFVIWFCRKITITHYCDLFDIYQNFHRQNQIQNSVHVIMLQYFLLIVNVMNKYKLNVCSPWYCLSCWWSVLTVQILALGWFIGMKHEFMTHMYYNNMRILIMLRIIFSIEIIMLLFVRELLIPFSPLERILKCWLIFVRRVVYEHRKYHESVLERCCVTYQCGAAK